MSHFLVNPVAHSLGLPMVIPRYINTFRIGPHVVNPVIHDLDAFESQVCTFLEEIGTPKLRSRLTGKDRRVAEVELGRLARLLAVLAAGSRYEDSDCATQVAISREYGQSLYHVFPCFADRASSAPRISMSSPRQLHDAPDH